MSDVLIPVGIDVSKAMLHIAVLRPEQAKSRYQSFENIEAGFASLQAG